MKKKPIPFPQARFRKNSILFFAVFGLILLACWPVSLVYQDQLINQKKTEYLRELTGISNSLTSAISRRESLVNSLVAFVKTNSKTSGVDSRLFEIFAAGLSTNDPVIRSIQYIPDQGTIYVYPAQGNEAILGRTLDNLRNDERPDVRQDIERTIQSGKITVSNPYELRQGGKGITARLTATDDGRFLGLVSVILNLEPLVDFPGLHPPFADFRFAIVDKAGQVFYGDPQVLTVDPVTTQVQLPEGSWSLASAPMVNWGSEIQSDLIEFWMISFLLAMIFGGVFFFLRDRNSLLAETVRHQSYEIDHQEDQLRLATEAAEVQFFDWNIQSNRVAYSVNSSQLEPLKTNDIGEDFQEWLSHIHPDDLQKTIFLVQEHLKNHTPRFEGEFRMKNGSDYRWILARGLQQFDKDGNPTRMIGCYIDTTKQKQSSLALASSENRFRRLAESSQDYIMLYDQQNRHVYENPAALQVAGHTEADIIGKTHREAGFSAEQSEMWEKDIQTVFATGESTQRLFEWESKGGKVYLDWRLSPILGPGGEVEYVLGISRDITAMKQAENLLRESEEKFRSLFNNNHAPMLLLDPTTGMIDDANPAACAFYGWPHAEIISKKISEINTLSSEEVNSEMHRAFLEERRFFQFQHRLADQSIRDVEVFSGPIKHNQKTLLFSIIHDITDRKQAEADLRKRNVLIETILEHAPIGFAINMIHDGTATYVSRKFEEIYGVPVGSLHSVDDYFEKVYLDPVFRQQIRDRILADMGSGDVARMRWEDLAITTQTGEQKVVTAINIPLFEQDFMISTVQDVTERWRAENEIRRLNTELEKRVAERTKELEVANKELESFSYSVSHDLRAPLRGIDGWSQALYEDYGNLLDEKGKQFIERVRNETQRMGMLIDDLLRLSRVSRIDMNRTRVNLSEMAQAIINRNQSDWAGRSLEIEIQPDMETNGDAQLLEIVLTNLLSNAVKFTSKKASAHIEFGRTLIEGKPIFFIKDNGAGFNLMHAKNLFGPFQRMHKQSDFPGTGIGLATVQRIILRHGGKVWAEAEKNVGATLYFTIEEAA